MPCHWVLLLQRWQNEVQWHRHCCNVCHQRFHCEVLQTFAVCRKEYVHLTTAFTLGSDVLQGHAAMQGTSCCNECGAIEYCYFRGDKTNFSDTGIAATFAISTFIVKCCKHLLSVEKNMRIWLLAFHWGVMSCKVMLFWSEHSAAMSAVPLSTVTSAVTKRSSRTQALLQCLPSAFPLWSAAKRCSL